MSDEPMNHDPTKSVAYILGELRAQTTDVLSDTKEIKELCTALEARVTSLEATRFRIYTIIATVSAFMGFIGSNIKEGLQWLIQAPTGQ